MIKIGLFFGSFNPFHIGHKIIGTHMVNNTDLDKVWYVVSPQNPAKMKESLLDQSHRLQIIQREIEDCQNLDVSDIEFRMPLPSYTIDTLVNISEKYSNYEFSLIMGTDNLKTLPKWKNYLQILNNYHIYTYPRLGSVDHIEHKNITSVKDVPLIDISASFIRESISLGKDMSSLIPNKAWKYIDEMNFYK